MNRIYSPGLFAHFIDPVDQLAAFRFFHNENGQHRPPRYERKMRISTCGKQNDNGKKSLGKVFTAVYTGGVHSNIPVKTNRELPTTLHALRAESAIYRRPERGCWNNRYSCKIRHSSLKNYTLFVRIITNYAKQKITPLLFCTFDFCNCICLLSDGMHVLDLFIRWVRTLLANCMQIDRTLSFIYYLYWSHYLFQ